VSKPHDVLTIAVASASAEVASGRRMLAS
jgi:hypothetical protein